MLFGVDFGVYGGRVIRNRLKESKKGLKVKEFVFFFKNTLMNLTEETWFNKAEIRQKSTLTETDKSE